jgi:hypothetical protein
MNTLRFARALAALCLGLALFGAPAFAGTASPTQPPVIAPAETQPARANDLQERQRRYAEREAATPQTRAFKGNGVGVYIGGSTLAVVLVVVLVVVLL